MEQSDKNSNISGEKKSSEKDSNEKDCSKLKKLLRAPTRKKFSVKKIIQDLIIIDDNVSDSSKSASLSFTSDEEESSKILVALPSQVP